MHRFPVAGRGVGIVNVYARVRSWGFPTTWMRRAVPLGTFLAVVLTLLVLPAPAQADTAPPVANDPVNPQTVAADALPTTQIDGVAWTQLVVGNTVYVGGRFTNARPAGAAPGVNTVPRSNLLAYDIRTGELLNSWAPTTNGEVLYITASPDKSRIYIGGSFTQVNGQTRNRIAALNPTTGAVVAGFNPNSNATVRTIVATNDTVYFGGLLTTVNQVTRARAAAVQASNGALLDWAPQAAGGSVHAMALSPDGASLVVGGSFTTMNGSSNPGYGLAALDPVTAAMKPFPVNNVVRNGGANAAILRINTDADSMYFNGYVFGSGGNLEGVARTDSSGKVIWIEDCHGDSYDTYPLDDAIYVATHAHYCQNVPGGTPQPEPWVAHRSTAFSKAPAGTLRTEYLNYFNFAGNPAPKPLHWFPRIDNGTFTGQGQGAWDISGNGDYVVAGGEFPRAGTIAQQGLVRFAKRSISPNTEGPQLSGSRTVPTVTSPAAGEVLVSWQANWDRDNENLTYRVMRNNVEIPEATRTVASRMWDRRTLSFRDTGLPAGSEQRYRIYATDPLGNESRSDTVTVTVSGSGTTDDYARTVTQDAPEHYWRLGDSTTQLADYTGRRNANVTGSVGTDQNGVIAGDPATTFPGQSSTTAATSELVQGPFFYSVEAWVKTTTNRGGRILGFSGSQTGTSASNRVDRMIYMTNSGRIEFGSRQGGFRNTLLTSNAYNDGQWHHIVGTVSDDGMYLYVDGRKQGGRTDARTGYSYDGYWRLGGDNLTSWSDRPTSDYFNGSIDEAAVYREALSANRVRAHYLASGRTLEGQSVPTDAYGKAVYDDGPELFWRLGETSGSTAADSSLNGNTGTYTNGPTLGGESAVNLAGDRSAGFAGSALLPADRAMDSPSAYTAETWFKTTSTSGGRLLGFGASRTTTAGTADRQLYMGSDGKLHFGVLASGNVMSVVVSPQAYNDGAWHLATIAQGSRGMKLYVDGVLVANNLEPTNASYNGYWRAGGAMASGWPGATGSSFAGSLDEIAVFTRELGENAVQDHFTKSGGELPNQGPTAAFSSQVDNLTAQFDSSGSNDPDGSIASYAWDFGDGSTSTQANPSHVYADPGTYTVRLTVTDNDGATSSTQDTVVTTSPAPTARFTSSVSNLTVQFDGSSSSDPDGSVASYAWDFGDGETGTTATPTHVYAAPGSYDVTLTVTDDDAGTDSVTRTVTVSDPPPAGVAASDAFGRSVTDGWGTADNGGAWTLAGGVARFDVANGRGSIEMLNPGGGPRTSLDGVSARDVDATVSVALDKLANGGGAFAYAGVRTSGNTGLNSYRAKVKVVNTGRVTLYVNRVVNGVETVVDSVLLPAGTTYAVGDQLRIRLQAVGSSPTTVRAKTWPVGSAEPTSWQVSGTDSAADLQGPGGVMLGTYLSGSSTNTPVSWLFDDLDVQRLGGEPANQNPVAAFSATPTNLSVQFDSGASSDPDGSVVGYLWDFGDGSTSTAANPSHTYATAGTYNVNLTVTDNAGASDSVTQAVTASDAPPAGVVASDAFGRTVSGGWGAADNGGTWTLAGGSDRFDVSGGLGRITMPFAGRGPRTSLDTVSARDVDATVTVGLDKFANGGGAFSMVGVRTSGDTGLDGYRAKVKVVDTGRVTLYVTKVVNGTETTLQSVLLPVGTTYAVGEQLRIRLRVTGTSPSTVQAKAWEVGTSEPASWQVSATDSQAALQDAGGVMLATYLAGTATNAPVSWLFDDFVVAPVP